MPEKIAVMEDIYAENHRIADQIRNSFTKREVLSVNILGAPGAGKTSVLIKIINRLKAPVYVIEGDVESDIDTKTLLNLGIKAYQINTQGGCHLDSPMISRAIKKFLPDDNSYLFIENIGNLICPAEFDIGEHIRLLICSVADGSDKPYKYPLAFEKASAIIVNKADLKPYMDFDEKYFSEGVRRLNKKAPIFFVSAKKDEGFEQVVTWLSDEKKKIRGKI